MKKRITTLFISILVMLIFAYIQLPVLKFDFISFYITLATFLIIYGVLNLDSITDGILSKVSKFCFGGAGVLIVYILVVPFITSTPLLHAESYRNLIGEVTESDFSADVSPVSVEDIRIVDQQTAMRLGDKKLGEVPGLGSVAKLGTFHIQSIDDSLYWVAPVVHRDTIKWLTNMQGTSGYIKVSATNPQDVTFVQELNNEPISIVYQPDAYLHQDLARHLYMNGFVNIGLTDFTFEVDDNGKPYWIVTLYEHKVGYSGQDAVGVATVDPASGKIERYNIENAPEWIDRIQPEYFIESQIKNWGMYVGGFFNSMIAEEGVLVPTPGTSLVYGEDGKSYWYTGITSSGADDATIGFILVDTRTKEAKLYKQPGATELAAMTSAEGKVQEKGYIATTPVMYNIANTPTYVISLKDKAGLIKMIAFVSVEDYSLLGLGETKKEALNNYRDALRSNGNNLNLGNSKEEETTTGKVIRFNQEVLGDVTYYYFTIDSLPNKIFTATSSISEELPLTLVNDNVTISFEDFGEATVDILNFDNNDLNIINN